MRVRLVDRRQRGRCAIAHSEVVEDHLKTVFQLCTRSKVATTSGFAAQPGCRRADCLGDAQAAIHLDVDPASSFSQVGLTEHWQRHPLDVMRRQGLLESFCDEFLDVKWHQEHEETEVVEHPLNRQALRTGLSQVVYGRIR
jgi:Iron dependent repressor, metal binding and dimerisation domain